MNHLQKYLSTCLLAASALLGGTSSVWATTPAPGTGTGPGTGTASAFAVLGGTNVTCTAGSVVGAVGVAPGSAVPFTNTGCTITGATPPATDAAAADARVAFLDAYAALQLQSSSCVSILGSTLAGENLAPGVYCLDAVAKTGLLTLTGPADGVWVFLVDGALTGTNFSVEMAGGGQPCNVFWAPTAAATLTTSMMKGNILAGDATLGSITLTGGTLAGQALANVAVTMTNANVIGCGALSDPTPGPAPCKCKCKHKKHHHGHGKKHGHDKHHGHNKHHGHDKDDRHDETSKDNNML